MACKSYALRLCLQRTTVAVSPGAGTVPPGGKRKLDLLIVPDSEGKFEATMQVDIKGEKPVRHILTGQVRCTRMFTGGERRAICSCLGFLPGV
jgi:hypothetical protein